MCVFAVTSTADIEPQLTATLDAHCQKLRSTKWSYIGVYKGKVHPLTGHEGPVGEQRYSSTLSLTSALDWLGGQRHAPAALPPGKIRCPLYRRLSGPQGRSGRVRKTSPPTGIRSPDRPARSESLYRLSYPGPHIGVCA